MWHIWSWILLLHLTFVSACKINLSHVRKLRLSSLWGLVSADKHGHVLAVERFVILLECLI